MRCGDYKVDLIYYKGDPWWIVFNTKEGHNHHTHVRYENYNAARMIAIRAQQGKIPSHYPDWMVCSINRLWFGKNYLNRTDLDNSNLKVKQNRLKFKRGEVKRGCKGYFNKTKFIRR